MKTGDFTELNDYFRQKITTPELFDCGNFNLLKLAQITCQHSIKNSNFSIRPDWKKPIPFQKLISFVRHVRNKNKKSDLKSFKKTKYIIYSGGNFVLNESKQLVSGNAENLINIIGKESTFIFRDYRGNIENVGQDYNYADIESQFNVFTYDNQDKNLLRDLKICANNVSNSGLFNKNEISIFESQIEIFFRNYLRWKHILKAINPIKIFISQHFRNEGLIAACRNLGIICVEIQHGLIAEEDFYYVYPESIKHLNFKSLFADEILVFGSYWKNILLKGGEYNSNQIKIIGDYQYKPKVSDLSKAEFKSKYNLEGSEIILIAAQKQLASEYAGYVKQLSAIIQTSHPNWKIVIKPHPFQVGLEKLKECSNAGIIVLDLHENLNLVLTLAKIQISIYSTTFYDAMGFDVVNFALTDIPKRQDYAEAMVNSGVALSLKSDQNPISMYESMDKSKSILTREQFFAPFNEDFAQL
jgi:hypothetical protein